MLTYLWSSGSFFFWTKLQMQEVMGWDSGDSEKDEGSSLSLGDVVFSICRPESSPRKRFLEKEESCRRLIRPHPAKADARWLQPHGGKVSAVCGAAADVRV